jgi:hypothetical protein
MTHFGHSGKKAAAPHHSVTFLRGPASGKTTDAERAIEVAFCEPRERILVSTYVSYHDATIIAKIGEDSVIKLLVERDRPPTFDLASDKEVARHARISVNAIAQLAGRFHWLCTYATEEKLFSVIVVDDETAYDTWLEKTKAYNVGLKIRRIVRVLDPSLAE